jgi:hypothetical protein
MTDEPQLFSMPRRRGRPRSTRTHERRTFYLETGYLDRLDRLALRHGVSTNEALRRVVDLALRMPRAELSDTNK